MYNWDRASGAVIAPQESLNQISPLYPTSLITVKAGQVVPDAKRTNFRPRTGVAYRIPDTFVIRGGYGQYTESLGAFTIINSAAGPYRIADTYINLDQLRAGRAPFPFPNPFPTGLGLVTSSQSITGFPVDTQNGVFHQFNVSLEKEHRRTGLGASIIGRRDPAPNYSSNINKPRPAPPPPPDPRPPH